MAYQRIVDFFLILLPVLAIIAPKALSPLLVVFALCYGIAFCSADVRAQARESFKRQRILLAITAALLAWALMSALWSVDAAESVSSWIRIASILMAGFASVALAKHLPPILPRNLHILILIFTACVGAFFLENYTPFKPVQLFMNALDKDYFTFITIDVNRALCIFAVMVWPVIYGLIRLGYPKRSAVLAVMLLMVLAAMTSQSAMLGMVVAALIWIGIAAMPKTLPCVLVFILPLAFFILPFFTQWALHAPEMQPALIVVEPYVSGRFPIWESLLSHNKNMLLWGQGLRTSYLIPMTPELLAQLKLQGPPMHPHNTPLQLLLELGVIGLALVSAGIFFVLRTLRGIADPLLQRAALTTIVAYIVTGLFSFNIWMNWWIACAFLSAIMLYRMRSMPVTQ
jgi:O-antigen ligase